MVCSIQSDLLLRPFRVVRMSDIHKPTQAQKAERLLMLSIMSMVGRQLSISILLALELPSNVLS